MNAAGDCKAPSTPLSRVPECRLPGRPRCTPRVRRLIVPIGKNNQLSRPMRSYVAVIHEHHGEFAVTFPDLPGCRSYHVATIEEARANAAADLGIHLQALIDAGQAIPSPSPITAIVSGREFKPDAVAILLAVRPVMRKAE
jgi:predicted RNase H-like HicB family nuclease